MRTMWLSMTASQVGYRLSWVAMFIRVAALVYALGVLTFYLHPDIAAKSQWLLQIWFATVAYTTILLVILVSRFNAWLRSSCFLVLDTLLVLLLVNLAGGGYRNVFSLYSLLPSVTTALSLPGSRKPFRRGSLLIGVVFVSSVGFVLSLPLDGYTFPVIIEKRQVDEVVLRTASYWVTGGLLAALAAMMIAWQYSLDRTNALREQTVVEEERRRIATDIHDGVLSQLSALGRRAEYASLMLSEDPAAAKAELQRVVTMAADVHEGIRWIVRALRQDPAELTLTGEVSRIVERFRRNTGMQVVLVTPDPAPPLLMDRHGGP
jgi:signal transduction histidine kinase